jgi:hypothetical protein
MVTAHGEGTHVTLALYRVGKQDVNFYFLLVLLVLQSTAALGKASIVVHQWTAKQFWVYRRSFKQKDNVYCLEMVQINQLNIYLQFKLNYDVCYAYESCLHIFPIIKMN